MADTTNYGWPLPDPQGIQQPEIQKIADALGLADSTVKALADLVASMTFAAIGGVIADAQLPDRLGPKAKTIADWNNALDNGWFVGDAAANGPSAEWYLGYVEAFGGTGFYTQTVHNFTGNSAANTKVFRREMDSGVWGTWYRLRWSEAEIQAMIDAAVEAGVDNLLDAAPGTLDTLNELAAAIGDDPNFAATISAQIGSKLPAASYTAADVLAKLKTVDGPSSGLSVTQATNATNADNAADSAKLGGLAKSINADANTIPQRDGLGDVRARLFRSEYATLRGNNYFMGQVALGPSATTDNFVGPMSPERAANILSGKGLKASTIADGGGNGEAMTFHWSGQPGQPTWVWGAGTSGPGDIYVWNPANFSVNYADGAGTATNCSRSVVAGNGLTGGGALDADRALALGTPGTLNGSTGNAVQSNSHTHNVDFAHGAVSLPVGAKGTSGFFKNNSGVTLGPGANVQGSQLIWASVTDTQTGSGSPTGTWESCGYVPNGFFSEFRRIV